ncbi:MAG: glutamyl-tRNA reductase [Solirubrobacterales bacterium]|nr:glutamyl-tRNA reductase [Solirubrobacterales bacterium]
MSELLALGLSHKTAPLGLRERLALPEGRAAGLMADLTGSGAAIEATVVSTCNRTEVYLVAVDPVVAESDVLSALASQADIRPTELVGHLYALRGPDAARHLFQVTAGLDSMILGEAEIQGQVKRAHELSLVEGASGPILGRLFRGAIAAGGRARNETGISEKGVSVASVAVTEARRAVGDLANRQALVVGAGDTAELVARALNSRGTESVFIANRHFDRAQGLAQRFGGEAARVADLPQRLTAPDIVISATNSPHHLIDRELLEPVMEARDGKPLFLVDLAVPRDIDPEVRDLPGVTVTDIDDLQVVVERNAAGRAAEARKAERIITAELDLFESWLDSLEVLPAVVALRERADEIVRRVLAENENRWTGLGDADRERVEAVARAVAQRLLHEPTIRLKELAGTEPAYEVVNTVRELFGLDVETDPGGGSEATVTPIRRDV